MPKNEVKEMIVSRRKGNEPEKTKFIVYDFNQVLDVIEEMEDVVGKNTIKCAMEMVTEGADKISFERGMAQMFVMSIKNNISISFNVGDNKARIIMEMKEFEDFFGKLTEEF